jgi:hypothetical protein
MMKRGALAINLTVPKPRRQPEVYTGRSPITVTRSIRRTAGQ